MPHNPPLLLFKCWDMAIQIKHCLSGDKGGGTKSKLTTVLHSINVLILAENYPTIFLLLFGTLLSRREIAKTMRVSAGKRATKRVFLSQPVLCTTCVQAVNQEPKKHFLQK